MAIKKRMKTKKIDIYFIHDFNENMYMTITYVI